MHISIFWFSCFNPSKCYWYSIYLLFQCLGFYGADCCLSINKDGKPELLAGLSYTPRKKPPKIYVYELPPALNGLLFNSQRFDRPLVFLFWQRLLSSGVRVAGTMIPLTPVYNIIYRYNAVHYRHLTP